MGLGGPVWHASAAPYNGWPPDPQSLRRFALAALEAVGDASLGEWEEWTGRAYHIRRRLSAAEQATIGPAVDIRGTAEAHKRLVRVLDYVMQSPQGMEVLRSEATGDA